jgi:hypothetical protein
MGDSPRVRDTICLWFVLRIWSEDRMAERDSNETESFRQEQGKKPLPDPRERLADVPLAPSSAGIVGGQPPAEESTTDADREQAVERERIKRREIL